MALVVQPRFAKATQGTPLAYKASFLGWELGIVSQVLDGARCQIRLPIPIPKLIKE
jgi:hypothetical protein